MSCIITPVTVTGQPIFRDLKAVHKAAEMLGLTCEERSSYRTYYGLSTGASLVLSVPRNRQAYEVGIVADPNNAGCYVPVLDTHNNGNGMCDFVGQPRGAGSQFNSCPKLIQYYQMAADALGAAESGDEIDFVDNGDGSWSSYSRTEARLGV